MDEVFIINGSTFNAVFEKHKFVLNLYNESVGTSTHTTKYPLDKIKISDDLEIHIRIKDKEIFFETEEYDLINIE